MMTSPTQLCLRDRDEDELNFTAIPDSSPGTVHVQMVQHVKGERHVTGFYMSESSMRELLEWYRGLV